MDDSPRKREEVRYRTDYLKRLNAMNDCEREAFLIDRVYRHASKLYFTSELWMLDPDLAEPKSSIGKIRQY